MITKPASCDIFGELTSVLPDPQLKTNPMTRSDRIISAWLFVAVFLAGAGIGFGQAQPLLRVRLNGRTLFFVLFSAFADRPILEKLPLREQIWYKGIESLP